MKKALALMLALIMVLSLAACGGNNAAESTKDTKSTEAGTKTPQSTEKGTESTEPADPYEGHYGGHLNYYWTSMGKGWDYLLGDSWTQFSWTSNIYEWLWTAGNDGVLYPRVAEFEVDEEKRTMKLWVREGVKFSDGDPVDMDDIIASINRIALKNSTAATWLENIEKQEVKDGVWSIQFKEGTTNFYMSKIDSSSSTVFSITKKEICEKYGEETIMDPNDVIGTGPYKLVPGECELGVKVEYVKNEHYCMCTASADDNGYASPARQFLDSMTLYIVSDNAVGSMMLLNGELDMWKTTKDEMETIYKPQGYKLWTSPGGSSLFFFFNTLEGSKSPLANDINLRKAICAAADYAKILEAYSDYVVPEYLSPLNSFTDQYGVDYFEKADYAGAAKLDVAKAYLAKSNYKGETLKLYISEAEDPGLVLIDCLKAAGINVTLNKIETAAMYDFYGDPANDWDIFYRRLSTLPVKPTGIGADFYSHWKMADGQVASDVVKAWTEIKPFTQESINGWKNIAKLMADEAPFLLAGGLITDVQALDPDLHLNYDGSIFRYWWNAYWDNPAEHVKK